MSARQRDCSSFILRCCVHSVRRARQHPAAGTAVNRASERRGASYTARCPRCRPRQHFSLLIDIVNCVCLKRNDTRCCNVIHSAAASTDGLSVLTCGLLAGSAEGGHVVPGLRGVRQQGAQQARRYKNCGCCRLSSLLQNERNVATGVTVVQGSLRQHAVQHSRRQWLPAVASCRRLGSSPALHAVSITHAVSWALPPAGVENVDIDLPSKKVTVTGNVTPEAVKEKVRLRT